MSKHSFTIPAGTTIKWQGLPFVVMDDITVASTEGNFTLANQLEQHVTSLYSQERMNNDPRLVPMIYGNK